MDGDVSVSKASANKLHTLGKKHASTAAGVLSIRRSSLAHLVFGGGQSSQSSAIQTLGDADFTLGFPVEPSSSSSPSTVTFRPNSPSVQLRRDKSRNSIVESTASPSPNRRSSVEQFAGGSDCIASGSEPLSVAVARELEQLGASRNSYTSTNNASPSFLRPPRPAMGRVMRVVVAGGKRVGKTAIMHQLACLQDITGKPYMPTIDDTYQIHMEHNNEKPKEILVFHDTAGFGDVGPVELRKPYVQVADAFLLVYSVADPESFNRVDLIKKFLDKQFGKEKKEVPIVVLGNMCDLANRKVDSEFAQSWAAREKVKLFEVTATDRSTLLDFVHFLAARYFHPPKESKFSLSKKLKPEKSNAAIVMDI